MKYIKIFILLIFVQTTNVCNSQILNLDFVEQLTNVSFEKLDELMTNGYGFEEFKKGKQSSKSFIKFDNKKPNDAMIVTLVKL